MNQRTAQKLQNALARAGRPMTPGEAAAAAGLSNRPDRFAALVNELTERGEILTTRAGNLIRPADAGLICAEIVSQSPHFCFAVRRCAVPRPSGLKIRIFKRRSGGHTKHSSKKDATRSTRCRTSGCIVKTENIFILLPASSPQRNRQTAP